MIRSYPKKVVLKCRGPLCIDIFSFSGYPFALAHATHAHAAFPEPKEIVQSVSRKSRLAAEVIVVFSRISYIEVSHSNITLPAVTIDSRFLIPGPAFGLAGCCVD
jgi:hypothetical protein